MTTSTDTTTKNERRRALLQAMLKATDVTIGVVAIVAGIYALLAPPPTIVREVSIPALVLLWGCLLIGGGAAATLGRLTGIWILETSGIAAAGFGTAIYLVVVSTAIRNELGVIVAVSLIAIAMLAMARRYIELQLFISEPKREGVGAWLTNLLQARTPKVGPVGRR